MIDITSKSTTLREAVAQAIVCVSSVKTIDAVLNNKVPKGNVFEMSKTAGLFAAKRTADMIPDCHPLPIESASIAFKTQRMEIIITVTIKTIYKTGVEVEAMHAASVVALTIYDMLKPIDKRIEIKSIKLLEKKGGKSDFKGLLNHNVNAVVIVISDAIVSGKKTDRVGNIIKEKLKNIKVSVKEYLIMPDDSELLKSNIKKYCNKEIQLLILSGGTGLTPKDVTTDTLKPLLQKEIPGIAETMRNYGQQRTPQAMISRSLAGYINSTLVIALPGSTKGAEESLDAIGSGVLHLFK